MDLSIDLVMSGLEALKELRDRPLSGMYSYPRQENRKSVGWLVTVVMRMYLQMEK